jgi:hypothetical protein
MNRFLKDLFGLKKSATTIVNRRPRRGGNR